MKKLGILVTLLCGTFIVANNAFAIPYAVDFDADGAGATYSAQTIYGWDLETTATESIPLANGTTIFGNGTGELLDLITQQDLGTDGILNNGDQFTENVLISVLNGLGPDPTYAGISPGYLGFPPTIPSANLYIETTLTGYVALHDDGGTPTTATTPLNVQDDTYLGIYNLGTTGNMFVDTNANLTYDAGTDVNVADITLVGGTPIILTPSVFTGAGAQINYAFSIDSANPLYFSEAAGFPDWFESVNAGFLLSLTQGGVAVAGQYGGQTVPDNILLAFQETGFDAKFEAIPEPASMLLLGTGLVGLAGFSRRRKKANKA